MNRDRAWRRFASLALVCAAITVAFVLWLATDAGRDKVTVAVDDIGEAAAALIAALAAASALLLISWATVLGTAFASTNESPAVQALALGYPVGDITVVTIALLVLSRTPLAGRITTVLLAAGFMSLAVADSMFAYLTSLGSFGSGNLLDTGWVAGFLLIGLAAAVPRADSAPMPEPAPNPVPATPPYVPVPLALTVAVVAAAIHGI